MAQADDQHTTGAPTDPALTDPALTDPATKALATAVHETERHVAKGGWDGPVRVFALVHTAAAMAEDPELTAQLPGPVRLAAEGDPHHLTSVEQEGLPGADSLEDLLAMLAWPETVDGAAVVVERVVLPPAAEADMPTEDDDAALAYLMSHPDRQDVRIAVGVLRSGTAWGAVRTRTNDTDDAVGGGPDLVPGLAGAIHATLL